MNGFAIAKTVGGVIGTIAGGQTVNVALKALTPENLSIANKVAVGIGGALMGGIVGSACGKYVEDFVDDIEGFVKGVTESKK